MIDIVRSLFEVLFALVESIMGTVTDAAVSTVPSRRKTNYDADFGSPNEQLHTHAAGFHIGTMYGNTALEANSHLICFGGSGSKKSSCICFPTLLQSQNASYVIHDCSRELFNGTASDLYNHGYTIFVFDTENVEQSICFNALAKCKDEAAVYRLANVLILNSLNGSSYDYWAQSAETIIGFFSYALLRYAEPQYANLYNVIHTIQVFSYNPQAIDTWIISTKDARLISQYKALVATPERTLQSSLASAKNALAIYNNPNLAMITSTDTLDFELFRKKKCALFLCGSPSHANYYRGVRASFFEAFFASILEKLPDRNSKDITFLIDEASTIRLSTLPQVLEVGRKYRISIATLWQDYNQTQVIYGNHEAANILANSRLKVFMPSGQPIATCTMLSELIGKYQYISDDGYTTKIRELLTPQEIYQLKKILVLNANNRPMLLTPHPFFENKKLLQRTKQPIYEITNTRPFDTPPLMQFEREEKE